MTESLNRSRAGHISTITKNQSSLKTILDKIPSEIGRSDLTRLKVSLKRCQEQQAKIQQLDTDIIATLEAADAGQDAIEQEQAKIEDNSLNIETFITVLQEFIDEATTPLLTDFNPNPQQQEEP